MQLTIEVPDDLAQKLEPYREHLGEILQLGMYRRWSSANSLRREIVSFVARGPRPEEIVEFHASEAAQIRLRELLGRSKEGIITEAEENELEEMRHLDLLVTSIKSAAWQHLRKAA
jgi:hypothetical protein